MVQGEKGNIQLTSTKIMPPPNNNPFCKTLKDVDRLRFGVAMCYIFRARLHGRVFVAWSTIHKTKQHHHNDEEDDVFEGAAQHIREALGFLDPNRWLTYQYELGYSNFDVAALPEAKLWFGTFVMSLQKL